jgi:hypothetical protein
MKKFFLSALVVCGSVLGFVACNNGDYDANPNANNSNIPNPFLNGGGGSVTDGHTLGYVSAKVNGNLVGGPGYAVDTLGVFVIMGQKLTPPYNAFIFNFGVSYDGKKTYEFSESSSFFGIAGYSTTEGTTQKLYSAGPMIPGKFVLEVTEVADNKHKGTFAGVMYNNSTGTPNTSDSIVITDGKFYISKK